MSDYPIFPDSSEKAPNVFIGVYGANGSQATAGGTGEEFNVINSKGVRDPTYFTSALYPLALDEILNINVPAISSGDLIQVIIPKYFTSVLYPMLVVDSLSVNSVGIQAGHLLLNPTIKDSLSIGVPSIAGGVLNTTIAYKNYTTSGDNIAIGLPSIAGGVLNTTIAYKNYTTSGDNIAIGLPSIAGGVLNTTINYVTYNNWAKENITVNLPSIVGGSLV